jgi:hypothetical protein
MCRLGVTHVVGSVGNELQVDVIDVVGSAHPTFLEI